MSSRWDIFAGYSYLAPKGTVQVPQPNGTTAPFNYDAVNVGGYLAAPITSIALSASRRRLPSTSGEGRSQARTSVSTATTTASMTVGGGLIMRFPDGNITPFVHALVDAAL